MGFFIYNLMFMEARKIEILEHIIKNGVEIRTIHKLLQTLDINKRDVAKIENQDIEFYNKLKKHCEYLVANLYELVIDRLRQATLYLQLAKDQEEFFNNLFGESTDNILLPEIVIKREKSSTNINIVEKKEK